MRQGSDLKINEYGKNGHYFENQVFWLKMHLP
jgi:hypothetical protein